MDSVLVLTAGAPLRDEAAEAAAQALAGAGAHVARPRRLAAEAVEIGFDGPRAPALSAARAAFSADPIDVNALAAARREKRLLISDMDSTVITVECIDEIAAHAGIGARVAAITERAMRGELDFEAALDERVGLLTGFAVTDLQAVYDERVTLTQGARALVEGMNARGALTALISGGFDFFTERVAAAAGFARHRANRLLAENGRLTGAVARPILGREAKRETLFTLAAEIGAGPEDALALGDGANDLGMIGAAGLGVAWRAKPAVAAAADARIDHADLTAVLRLQGVPANGFG
ncbi:phosphoserine phosphatase SerB [Pikeienuella piscinae]|uniref:Phosphoserine phosphatase n=1 Tax=Pikeienuella piscinae TaxID=2748098 RepID=A0A7M3T6P1_9RHOB|nr:phosphoserine phosphatase SerB [Pikeienuella piscinae]QIE57672.1 phosphoserine phosphatase SerB [Pikeienuella piscinae]